MRLASTVVIVVVVAVTGCATPRVVLSPPPPAEAPLVERERAWEALRPLGTRPGLGMPAAAPTQWNARPYVVLGGGVRVEDPRDLVVVVGDGPLKDAAARAEALDDEAAVWSGVGWAACGVGAVISVSSLGVMVSTAPAAVNGDPAPVAFDAALIGVVAGSAVMMGGIVPTWVASVRWQDANVEKDTAFLLYGDALRRRLDLPRSADDVAFDAGARRSE